uniref:Transmembrane protein 150C n=1 Tax=Kryptolebias marmoratus TaxID=37003 RepID=A0A3Q3FIS0_KRYMA
QWLKQLSSNESWKFDSWQESHVKVSLGFVIGVLRFLQLKNNIDKPWLNYVSATAFSIGCFGMTLVGNFQVSSNLIHEVGTLMTFGLGTVYFWMQSYITLRVNLKNEGKIVSIARFLLSAAITLCIILKQFLVGTSYMHAARCQWALVMFFLIFISTFSIEFRHCGFEMSFKEPVDDLMSAMETSDVFRQQLEPL